MRFGVGVIGATGYIGVPYRREIREAADEAVIVAVCGRREKPLAAAGQEDGATLITQDWRHVVEHPGVNLVVVATPDALHYDAVLATAAAGKHVVCEKPVGTNVAEATAMWAAYRDTKLAHFVPFWTRYAPPVARARKMVRDGELGSIKAIVYRWHNPRPAAMPYTWRDDATLSSAGSIADVGSHGYDTIRWILGRDAVRVLAHADVITSAKADLGAINLSEALEWGESHRASEAAQSRRATAFDYASIAFDFADGTVGTLLLSHATYIRKGLAPELELHGTDASLAIDRIAGTLTRATPDGRVEVMETIPQGPLPNRFKMAVFPALRAQLAGQPEDHPDLEDGLAAQRFTDAAAASARQGRWISLDEA